MKHHTILTMMLCATLAACSSTSPDPKSSDDVSSDSDEGGDTDEGGTEVPEGAGATCLDEQGEPLACETDDECCEGFECGYDPEGSTRIKTCLWTGG